MRVVNQLNGGDSHARNVGIRLARGEHLLMFDADNVLEPDFVARAAAILRSRPELAYVTCWMRFIRPDGSELGGGGYAALGNSVLKHDDENWDGDTTALLSRRVLARLDPPFDPRSVMHGDWAFYRRLRALGEYGAVIPETLLRYRVHGASKQRSHPLADHRRSWREVRDWRRLVKLEADGRI